MIMTTRLSRMLPKPLLERPELKVLDSKVAQALDHLQALQRIEKEWYQEQLKQARARGLVVRIKPQSAPGARREGSLELRMKRQGFLD